MCLVDGGPLRILQSKVVSTRTIFPTTIATTVTTTTYIRMPIPATSTTRSLGCTALR